jgi:hypothetical protein
MKYEHNVRLSQRPFSADQFSSFQRRDSDVKFLFSWLLLFFHAVLDFRTRKGINFLENVDYTFTLLGLWRFISR